MIVQSAAKKRVSRNKVLKKAFAGAYDHFSKVSIIEPSFAVPASDVEKSIAFWAQKNVILKRPAGVVRRKDILCAHSLDSRLEELKKAFSAQEESDFVWALRGGYGLQELVPHLKKKDFAQAKIFMGFSDATSLHYHLNKNLNTPSLHAPHPNWFANHKSDKIVNEINSFFKKLYAFSPEFKCLKRLNLSSAQPVFGKLIGGNLTTMVSVVGTKCDKGARSNILFLEEVEEPAYKINRLLVHLSQSGFLKGVKALVFGHFNHSSPAQEKLIKAVLKRWALEQKFPVVTGMQAGHIHQRNRPFWLGKKSCLVLDEKPRLLNNV